MLGSAAGMRQASVEASHHASAPRAFGAGLVDQPADGRRAGRPRAGVRGGDRRSRSGWPGPPTGPAAATRRARAAAAGPARRQVLGVQAHARRIAAEALECLGGNGYVEESGLPRLYREAPLNSIWEGSGNVTALDVLRALARTPGSADALLAELDLAAGGDQRLDAAVAGCGSSWPGWRRRPAGAQYRARRLAGLIAVTMQAALLVRHRQARCATRSAPRGSGPAAGRRARCTVRRPAGRASIRGARSWTERLSSPIGSADAPLAGNSLPAGRDLGRRWHQLRAVLRGGGAGGAVPVR